MIIINYDDFKKVRSEHLRQFFEHMQAEGMTYSEDEILNTEKDAYLAGFYDGFIEGGGRLEPE